MSLVNEDAKEAWTEINSLGSSSLNSWEFVFNADEHRLPDSENDINVNPKTPKPHQFVKSNFDAENAHREGAARFGGPDDLLARFQKFPYLPLSTLFN